MDIATLAGGLAGTIVVFAVMAMSGSIIMYWDFMSLMIVVGGATASSMMRWPLENFIGGVQVGMGALFDKLDSPETLIDKIIELANMARKESILALEKVEIENKFMAKGIKLAVDGNDPGAIESILDSDMEAFEQKLKDGRGIFNDMGEACPAFGMIGTVIGLIVIMANLSDPSKIGPGLAVALVTTLYGSLISNMFFIPVSKKLTFRGAKEMRNNLIIKTGVRSILDGENPALIRERLEGLL